MSLLSEFNPSKIDYLRSQLEKVLDEMTKSLDDLEKSTIKLNNGLQDRVSVEASKIVGEYKRSIKRVRQTVAETMTKVKELSNGIKATENMSDNLR